LKAITLLSCGHLAAGVYELSRSHFVHKDFFSAWNFWNRDDPSNGFVNYVDQKEAERNGLAKATAEWAYLGVEMNQSHGHQKRRRSVRIESKESYNSGLFVVGVSHAPTGCGVWPAFWMYGEDADHIWPAWGEFDIIEGMHKVRHSITTLHTSEGCDQANVQAGTDFSANWELGSTGVAADSCNVDASDQFKNQGCSQTGPHDSLGEVFNAQGGGTYAAEWDPDNYRIRTWYWPMGRKPRDLVDGYPEPSLWGRPYSYFTLDPALCPASHLQNMRLVFSLNLCGDLGNSDFARSCPEAAKTMSCEEFVSRHPENLTEAYWSIRSLDVYQKKGHARTEEEQAFRTVGMARREGFAKVAPAPSPEIFLSESPRISRRDQRIEAAIAAERWQKVLGVLGSALGLSLLAMVVRVLWLPKVGDCRQAMARPGEDLSQQDLADTPLPPLCAQYAQGSEIAEDVYDDLDTETTQRYQGFQPLRLYEPPSGHAPYSFP